MRSSFCRVSVWLVISSLVAALGGGREARAQGGAADGMIAVAIEAEQPGRTLLFIVDPASGRLLVYRRDANQHLTLESVRNFEYDLHFEQFPAGASQRPSVKEVRDMVTRDAGSGARGDGLGGLVERELELLELRGRLAEAAQRGEPVPTHRGVPLSTQLQELERESMEVRLKLASELGLDAFQRRFLEELREELARVTEQIELRKTLLARLPEGHGGVAALGTQLGRLGRALERLEALVAAEAPPAQPAPEGE